ncbi:MAG: aminoacyl-tRNA hydrolase [Bacteroidales bacterium]|nr:aminoacyl-tRNA hydrolase [Bacteroidales bacterium]
MCTLRERYLENECSFVASRSSGPGGQHVNKVSTRIDLRFNIAASLLLTDEEKARITSRLKKKISEEGIIVVSCQEWRSQLKNKKTAIEKFYEILERALKVPRKRRVTRLPESFRKKRLQDKKLQSEKKNLRKTPPRD